MSTPIIVPTQFTTPLERGLALLCMKKVEGVQWLSAVDISQALRDDHGLTVHWRTLEVALRGGGSLVARRKRANRFEYAVMAPGEQAVRAPRADALVVDPTKALQTTITLHALLAALQGAVRVCDPYVDHATLQHLEACTAATSVQVLSDNISDTGRLRALIAAAAIQTPRIELRRVVGHRLHDRYIIDGASMHLLGASLNGFGKKQCFVVRMGQDIRSTMLSFFTTAWASARPWP